MQTPETIRQMGGHALTQLAWELGLTPEGSWQVIHGQPGLWAQKCIVLGCDSNIVWRPHATLAQADAVFRGLRGPQWELRTVTRCGSNGVTFGRCEAVREDGLTIQCDWIVPTLPDQDTEALALLRCAVLARASEEDPHG